MSNDQLRVGVGRHGAVSMLSVSGELDFTVAENLAGRARRAISGPVERLVVDLSGLTFIDCDRARTLAMIRDMRGMILTTFGRQ